MGKSVMKSVVKPMTMIMFIIALMLFFAATLLAGTVNLPQTGQTSCWDASGNIISCTGTGQDGDIKAGVAWPSPRFTNADGSTPISGNVVLDQLTGLMWTTNGNLPGTGLTWTQALDYVAAMNSGSGTYGYTDWRLPNVVELESLVNAGQSDNSIWLGTKGFTNVQPSYSWSSNTSAGHTGNAWLVSMSLGDVVDGFGCNIDKSHGYNVWPVRTGQQAFSALPWATGQTTSYYANDDGALKPGVAWPIPRFTNPDGSTPITGNVVLDQLTGLMWTKSGNLAAGTKSWQGALDYAASMNTGSGTYGYTDWRLPNETELRSLLDYSKSLPALPAGNPFTNVQSSFYWSSTTLV
jgi:hypothetical protein